MERPQENGAREARVSEIGRAYADHRVMLAAPAGGAEQAAATVRAVQERWPSVRFVIGGSGLTSRTHSRPGMEVCRRVSAWSRPSTGWSAAPC